MSKRLGDMSNDDIARMIEEDLYQYCIDLAESAKRTVHIEEDVSWTNIYPTCWPNYIFKANFAKDNIEERVLQVIDSIKKNIAPPNWVIGPSTGMLDIEYLENHGFKRKYTFTCMALDLHCLEEVAPTADRFKMEVVMSKSQLAKWADVVSAGLFNGGKVESELFEYFIESGKARLYIGLYDEIPVATSMLYFSSSFASISMVSTLPEVRRKGLGTSMVIKPLADAKDLGYEIAVLQATRAGEPVYRKIGFNEYSTLHILNIEI